MQIQYTLRKYQQKAVNASLEFVEASKGKKKGVMALPCGAGKSICIAKLADTFNTPTLVLQPSKELLEQNYEKYISYGQEAAIYSASMGQKNVGKGVTFATPLSLKGKSHLFQHIGLVIIDECHVFCKPGSTISTFLSQLNKNIKVVGFTATPVVLRQDRYEGSILRMVNRTRDSIFQDIIHVTQIREMVEDGFWTPIKYDVHRKSSQGLRLNSSGSEYTDASLNNYFFTNHLDEAVVDAVDKLKETRKSILVFAPSIAAAESIAKKIKGSAVVHSKMSKSSRKTIIDGFRNGYIQVVVNVSVLEVGFDYPLLSCVVDTTPTNSIAKYYQRVGRVVRIHPDKSDGLIVDMGGNFDRFGRLENLTFENLPNYGWGCFNGEECLSAVCLRYAKPTKSFLMQKHAPKKEEKEAPMTIWFGTKHKGVAISALPENYVTWLLYEWGADFSSPKMKALKTQLEIRLKVLTSQKQAI